MFTGTGLGLTIVKQFVEAMGGHVKVESTLNKGSRFILTIPFDLPEHSQPLVYKPILSTPRVAVIDGNSVVAESLSQGLEDAGYIPDIIMSGQPAELDQFSQSLNQYGLVIVTSEALKRSRVFDLVVDLRGRESIPVVSILSPFEISVRERLVALDIPLVMTRPISLLDILGVIDGAISLNSESWDDAEDFSLHTSRPLEILIADDARTNQIILTELLRDAGHNVMCVDNGEDLVARVRDSMEQIPGMPKFDIVLTDVQMPLLDGLSATARIRAIERDSESKNHLPIVAVTAHAMTDEINRMRLFGVDDIATKPLDPIRLGEIIQRLTGKESASSPSEESRTNAPEPSADELCSSGLRLWTQMAQRSSDLGELFSLSDDPSSPEDFQRVLDIADVIERSGDSVRRTRLIFLSFLECFREQLHKLHDAKNTKQVHDLQFSSHALKGLLLDLGAKVSAGIASSIEQMCKDNEGEQAFLLVGKLIKQTLLVARLVEQLCDMVGPSEIADDKAPVLDMSELLNTED
jgi:CheY-like chemotaxis protein